MGKSKLMIAAAACALALGGGASAKDPAYKVVGQISMADGGWDYATFDPGAHKVYLARGAAIQSLDVNTLELNAKVATATGSHAPVPLPEGRMLITNGGTNTVTIVNLKDGTQIASIPTGKLPDGAIYDPSSKLAFVGDHGGGEVVFIDPKTQTSAGQVMVGGTLEFLAADGKGHVFVNIEDKSQIAKIDIKSKAVSTYALDGCKSPSGLAYAAGAGVLIAACSNKVAAVVDPATGQTIKTLAIGDGPDAVLYDPTRKLAFVPCGQSGDLAVISAASKDKVEVIQTVPTQSGARTGTVDPKTGRLYLAAELFRPPTAAGQRRGPPVPGTAVMVVVAP
jgi:DNA-binding beta-propeller fold protein YncE